MRSGAGLRSLTGASAIACQTALRTVRTDCHADRLGTKGNMAIARKFGDAVHFWNVPDIQAAAQDLPVQQVSTAQFDLDIDAWFGEACDPTIKNVVHHMKYIQNADLDEPIILSVEGHVFDGQHRLAKCLLDGICEIPAKQFGRNPPPFKVVRFDEFKEQRPLIAASLKRMETGKL
jgi:hypothetical protein